MRMLGGIFIGAVGLLGFQYFTKPDAIEGLRLAALTYAEENSVEPVWLFQTISGGLISGSGQTVLFFGYLDNFAACEELETAHQSGTSTTSTTCERVE